jgi:outer membrane biosynthesis protein TonB
MNIKFIAIPAIALAAGIGLTACGTTHTIIIKAAPTVTHTVTAPAPKPVKTTPAPAPKPTTPAPTTPAPTTAVPTTQAPAPVESTPAASAHAGEVYCTYERMDTDVCTNGGYVTVSNSAYEQAIAEYGNAYSLSGWFPLSQVQG